MDKWLLAAFVSSLAGFFTAIVSVVKLVNEKENKTSSYRQEWTTSIRGVFADFSSTLLALTVLLEEQERFCDLKIECEKKEGSESEIKEISALLEKTRDQIVIKRNDLYRSYALTKLHFKPNDQSFSLVEQKYDIMDHMIRDMIEASDHEKRIELKGEIKRHISELINLCRDILKTEWETIKRGEHAYKVTKKYALWGGVITMFFVISIGIHAYVSMHKTGVSEIDTKLIPKPSLNSNQDERTVSREKSDSIRSDFCGELNINNTINQHFEDRKSLPETKKTNNGVINKNSDCSVLYKTN